MPPGVSPAQLDQVLTQALTVLCQIPFGAWAMVRGDRRYALSVDEAQRGGQAFKPLALCYLPEFSPKMYAWALAFLWTGSMVLPRLGLGRAKRRSRGSRAGGDEDQGEAGKGTESTDAEAEPAYDPEVPHGES